MFVGSWKVDDLLTFDCATHTASTGAATDADGAPAYRVYEDETTTPILTGTMALLDSANTVGLYSEQITLSAANGFEKGKRYTVYISAAVGGVTGVTTRNFQMEAEVDVRHWVGSVPSALISGRVDASIGNVQNNINGLQRAGAAQSVGATSLVMDAGAAYEDGMLIGNTVRLTSGTHIGATGVVTASVGATDTLTIGGGWSNGVTPTGTPTFEIWGSAAGAGVAQTGDAYAIVNSGTFGNAAIKTALDGLITTIGASAAGVASAVWGAATRLLSAGTNIVLDKGTGITGFNDLSAAQVNAEADTALADVGVTTTVTGRIDAAITTRASAAALATAQTSIDDLPTNAELATALAAADDAVLAAIAALNNLAAADVLTQVNSALTTAVADSVPADGSRPSIAQAAYLNTQFLLERTVSGTTLTVRKPDGSTTLITLTLNDATTPTALTRAT